MALEQEVNGASNLDIPKIPTEEQAAIEGKVLCLKLLMAPDRFTLTDLARLQEIMAAEGFMK